MKLPKFSGWNLFSLKLNVIKLVLLELVFLKLIFWKISFSKLIVLFKLFSSKAPA